MGLLGIDLRELLIIMTLRLVKRLHLTSMLDMNKLLRGKRATYAFNDYFKGLGKVQAVRRIFGEKTEEVLRNLRFVFTWLGGYMWVNSANGYLMVNPRYLNRGDKIDIYLDLIHELIHVKQFMGGKELFDSDYSYIERITEVEA